ncbi:MAG: hypothetical protein JST16_13365 [Bdellovibrionales bacterium]|nr:hypothetical protein [Bdellovibrionales bacterium]
MKTFVLASLVSLAFLGGCGSSSSSDPTGTWALCLYSSSTQSAKYIYTFSGTTVGYTITSYSSGDCSGAGTVSTNSSGTFVSTSSTTVTDAYNLDITWTSGTTVNSTTYQIFQISSSKLYLGDVSSTYNGSTVALRPISLSANYYTKQ